VPPSFCDQLAESCDGLAYVWLETVFTLKGNFLMEALDQVLLRRLRNNELRSERSEPRAFRRPRGYAAAQCGKAMPFRQGFNKVLGIYASMQRRSLEEESARR
jgi:hypothetical protein